MDAVPPWQSSTLTPTRTYGSRYPGAELQLHEQQPEERAEERAERLAEAKDITTAIIDDDDHTATSGRTARPAATMAARNAGGGA